MKNKYNIGDKIWRIRDGKVVLEIITVVILTKSGRIAYSTRVNDSYSCYADDNESQLFLTKEDLIASL